MYGKDNLDLNYRIDNLDVFGTLGFEKGKNTNSSKKCSEFMALVTSSAEYDYEIDTALKVD